MSRLSKFQPYSVNGANKKIHTVPKFLGVDYSPAQLQVASNRAVEMENIIFKDGFDQKRTGWEQVAQVKPYTYYEKTEDGEYKQKTNSTNFNGLWFFTNDAGQKCCVAHIGKILYKAEKIGRNYTFLETKFTPITKLEIIGANSYNVAVELEDFKSSAFVGNNCLFIFGGNKLYKVTNKENNYQVVAVEDDENTYIPVTTTGITYVDSSVDNRTPLDDVNLMTQYRVNKLVSGTYIDDGVTLRKTRFWDWQLDTNIQPKKPTDINNIEITINSLEEVK